MSIQITNLFHTYLKKTPQKVEALENINLEIEQGSFVALLGETGSGKTTLAQHLNALLLPDSGQVKVDDFIIISKKRKNKHIHELRKHIGLVFQFPEYQLFEETVLKDVAFGPKNFGASNEDALKSARLALEKVGIPEQYYEKSPFELSGGERRRVAFAGILAINPDILVLDEPTAGLDPKASREIMQIVSDLHKDGKTIILITHDMDLVLEHADKVFYLDHGVLTYQGTPQGLFIESNMELEIPALYKLVLELNKKGANIPIEKIRTVDDIFLFLKGVKK